MVEATTGQGSPAARRRGSRRRASSTAARRRGSHRRAGSSAARRRGSRRRAGSTCCSPPWKPPPGKAHLLFAPVETTPGRLTCCSPPWKPPPGRLTCCSPVEAHREGSPAVRPWKPPPGRLVCCSPPWKPPPGRLDLLLAARGNHHREGSPAARPWKPPPGRLTCCSPPWKPPPGRLVCCSPPWKPPPGSWLRAFIASFFIFVSSLDVVGVDADHFCVCHRAKSSVLCDRWAWAPRVGCQTGGSVSFSIRLVKPYVVCIISLLRRERNRPLVYRVFCSSHRFAAQKALRCRSG